MRLYIYFTFVFCFILSCSSPQSEKLQLGQATELKAQEFEHEIIMSNPLGLEMIDNNLFIFQSTGEYAALIMNINNGSIIDSWGIRGNGPGEFMYPLEWGINRKEKMIYLHNLNRFQLRQYKYSNQELTLLKETSFKGLQSSVREATVLENGNIIASVIYGNDKPLLLLNSQLDSLNNFGELPDDEHKTIDLRTYSSILSSYKNTFIQVMYDLGYLACYEQKDDNTILKKWEYYLEKPIYKGSQLNRALLKRGFTDVKMTPNYIFCVYSGQKWDLTSISDQPKNILVFNHKGKLITNFHLDRAIGKIAVSEDEKIIFAVSIEPDIDIVRYDIADRL